MNDVIERLLLFDTTEALAEFVVVAMPDLHELYNSGWDVISAQSDRISEFILFKHRQIEGLDFTVRENRAFLLMLLDFAERLNLQSSVPHIVRIINRNSELIYLNKRLSAGVSYIYPRPHTSADVLDKYSAICSGLQDAIETEEDDEIKSAVTFLGYYSAAIDLLSGEFARELKSRIESSLRTSEYPFLNNINGLADVDVSDPLEAMTRIQAIIDDIIRKTLPAPKPVPVDEFIIEEGTQYSIDLQRVPCNFNSIRNLSVRRATGNSIAGRGVQQIQSEDGLFDYFRNYGNMHRAKVRSALDPPFPRSFDEKLSLIDWGCGQGLASMVFMDKYGTENIKQIILIEPSERALRRAALHCKKYAPDVPLQTICKEFDDLNAEDIHLVDPEIAVHMFSNVLDMECYDVQHLANVAASLPGSRRYFVCISPYIDDIRTSKIDSFVELMRQTLPDFTIISDVTNTKYNEFWNCNNMETGYARRHGSGNFCGQSTGAPCLNRWTRVMRVFSA